MPAKVDSCSLHGIDGFVVEVEVDISFGLPVFNMVGLPEVSVRESKDRVKAAINNCGYTFPMDRVIVNLAPADVKKHGSGFDLPIALGILTASGLLPQSSSDSYLVAGELSLDGRVKPVRAVLSYALCAKENGYQGIVVPFDNASEAAMVQGIDVLPVKTLGQIVDHLCGVVLVQPFRIDRKQVLQDCAVDTGVDFCEVKGQHQAKRALEIASAGFHNVLML